MRNDIVVTLTGADRVGVIEEVTGVLLELGANIETSRMTRLGGEFAMLMLVSLPEEALARMDSAFTALSEEGYRVTVTPTDRTTETAYRGWLPYRVSVEGADHEGIIHEIASGLSASGITLESVETGTRSAPITGTPLFAMDARVLVPPHLAEEEWTSTLIEASRRAGVDIEVARAETE